MKVIVLADFKTLTWRQMKVRSRHHGKGGRDSARDKQGPLITSLHSVHGTCLQEGLIKFSGHLCLQYITEYKTVFMASRFEYRRLRLCCVYSESATLLEKQFGLTAQSYSNNLKGWWEIH